MQFKSFVAAITTALIASVSAQSTRTTSTAAAAQPTTATGSGAVVQGSFPITVVQPFVGTNYKAGDKAVSIYSPYPTYLLLYFASIIALCFFFFFSFVIWRVVAVGRS
jgi:hypothetical protein